jgi:hypothetical protein
MNVTSGMGVKRQGCGERVGTILLLLFLALVFGGIGGWFGYGSWQLVNNGEHVTAVVIENELKVDNEGGKSYLPHFRYAIDGQTYEQSGPVSTNPPAFAIGEEVEILVDPAQPEKIRPDRFFDLWLVPIIMLGLAGILLLVAFFSLIFSFLPGR